MKLVGYCRVSTEGQEDNTSLENQRRRIEAYCQAFDHELMEVFVEVGSGKDTVNRPQFQSAMEMVATKADGIVALKLDRIARSCRDVLTLVEDVLQPSSKALVLLDLNVDTSTPTGKMILTMMAAVAELERAQINERCQGGRKAKADAGGYAYGTPAFGFAAQEKELVPVEDEQQTIALIRRHRRSGKSYAKIADYLNGQGIPTKRGKEWNAMQVHRIIQRTNKQRDIA
jgi:DNA invertase Pin-like site-specific DNA recombinase